MADMTGMKILLVGSGGREHALAWKLAASPHQPAIICAPGNPGMASLGDCIDTAVDDIDSLAALAQSMGPGLTVIGPEATAAAGLADRLHSLGLRVFGPTAAATRIESSRQFAKKLMTANDIATARHGVFNDNKAATDFLHTLAAPYVIKADGLAAGKGVVIAHTLTEAQDSIKDMLAGRFGDASRTLVIEEFLHGTEASVFVLSDGRTARYLGDAEDYKRAHDGDAGPNTGGMGAISPSPRLTDALRRRIMDEVIMPTLTALADGGAPFVGVLYAGLMIGWDDSVSVVEFNARFGDPECQALMVRMDDDLLAVLMACAEGNLADLPPPALSPDASATVVIASRGYPGPYQTGARIDGIADAQTAATVFQAGTRQDTASLVSAGGRVVSVTARGPDAPTARQRAYAACDLIAMPDSFYRSDIGLRDLSRPSASVTANTVAFEDTPLIDPSGFREYDARWWFGTGAADEPAPQLNLTGVRCLGLGLGVLLDRMGAGRRIVVGHDYRACSMSVKNALSLGLVEAGMEVHDIGLALSPTAYFAQSALAVRCVAMVTASHNDNGWTGVKMGAKPPVTFGPGQMAQLCQTVLSGPVPPPGAQGRVIRVQGMRERHIAAEAARVTLSRRLKVVVACGNGTAGVFAPEVLRGMGAEVIELDCAPDHDFPRYNPNPEDMTMLAAMSEAVERHKADLAVGFDGDGDRCGVVDDSGSVIFADKTGLLLARDLARRHPGAHFVVDVKSTGLYATDPVLAEHGASVEYFKTGHSHIKRRVRDSGALAGFEKSGHFFFAPPIGLGYDDGLTSAGAVLAMLDNAQGRSLSQLKEALAVSYSSPTMSAHCPDEVKYDVVDQVVRAYQELARDDRGVLGQRIREVTTVNGARVTLADGSWLLVRASSNKPELVVVVESMTSEAHMQALFRGEVKPRLAAFPDVGAYNQEI